MEEIKRSPPQLFLRLFRWYCHPRLVDHIEGDLIEVYRKRIHKDGKRKADIKFGIDVLLLFRPGIIKPAGGTKNLNTYGMYKSYFKIGWRNLVKNKVFSFINVFGLALAMSVCMIIMLMLADQKSYDQFHSNKSRIYRILTDKANGRLTSAVTSFPLAPALKSEYSVVEQATHLHLGVGGDGLYAGKATELRGYFADAQFFKVFDFDLKYGKIEGILSSPHSMVVTAAAARELFGDENPLGKIISFSERGLNILKGVGVEASPVDWGMFTITGVIDTDKTKSHLKFDVLVSYPTLSSLIAEKKKPDLSGEWMDHNVGYTYVLTADGKTEADLATALNDLVTRKYAQFEKAKGLRLIPQKLTKITPGIFLSSPASFSLPIQAYYFLFFLALAIMLSACLNYTNLSTARALSRAREVGVRKVTGASRRALVLQFLSESILISLFALVLGFVLTIIIQPFFTGFWINRYLLFDLKANFLVYSIFVGFAVLIGCIAGIYPAFRLSGFQPVYALKNTEGRNPRKLSLLRVLSTSQFVISLFFITSTILIYKQSRHHMSLEYGLNPKDIINVSLQDGACEKAIAELGSVAGVLAVSASDKIPGSGQGTNGVGLKILGKDEAEKNCDQFRVDDQFISNLEIPLLAGRNLPKDPSDRFVVVNESAVKELGFASAHDMLGQVFQSSYGNEVEVVGVVQDFRYRMPTEQDKIGPMILRNQKNQFRYLQLKIASNGLAETIARLQRKWKTIDPVHPFKYQFYDEQLRATNKGFVDVITIVGFIAFLAITIACLGLLGMTTHLTERRKKEVGIRKVLGAGELAIAFLLSKGFLRILVVSIFLGLPLTYFANNLWLQNFPNRVTFGWEIMALGTFLLIGLGSLTIGSQTIMASRRNPIEALKE